MIQLYNYFLDNEVWVDIEDFPDYQISNYGRIRCLNTLDFNTLNNIKFLISEIICYFKY